MSPAKAEKVHVDAGSQSGGWGIEAILKLGTGIGAVVHRPEARASSVGASDEDKKLFD